MYLSDKYYQCIDIVLAVYNGEKYLEAQLNSLRNNQHYEFLVRKVIVVDDGSLDNSINILRTQAKKDTKIEIILRSGSKLGAVQNFSYGASLTKAEFVMFCDQDDIWLSSKIIDSLNVMLCDKSTKGRLVFSDLKIVDRHLKLICPSYFTFKKIHTDWQDNLDNLVKQNVVSGCTMMVNQALLHCALPIPNEAYMHDWWLALVAKIEGEIIFIDKASTLYRQHETNTIGVGLNNRFNLVVRLKNFVNSVDKSILQAQKLLACYPALQSSNPEIVFFSAIPFSSLFKRIYQFSKGHFRRSAILGNIGMFIYLLCFARGWQARINR